MLCELCALGRHEHDWEADNTGFQDNQCHIVASWGPGGKGITCTCGLRVRPPTVWADIRRFMGIFQ